jgi:hypothetical protein
MNNIYANLSAVLQNILVEISEENRFETPTCLRPDNDYIASTPSEGLDLARKFSQIRDPVIRKIVIKFVMKIAMEEGSRR